ncbi:MAG TPA: AraC family transcriptional regulator [Bryobacteraceae bacterium]|nr:AraC family transcriptional regulator [Bryobacteraceae bacterium]
MLPSVKGNDSTAVQHPLIFTAPSRLGPLVDDELFRRLCRSRDYLAANLDQPHRLSDAARQAYLSPFHYHRLFTRAFGETPHEFLTRLRIDEAKRLLAREQLPVTEVCLAVGYGSLGSFSSLFRNTVGYSPAEFQRAIRRIFAVPAVASYQFVPNCFLRQFGARMF